MRHWNNWQTQPHHFADLASPHAGSVYHDLGLDRPLVCDHFVYTSVLEIDACNGGVEQNLRAAILRANGKRVGQTGRVDAAIIGRVCCADHAFDVHQREHILRFFRRDHFHRHTEGTRHAHEAAILFHALERRSQAQTAYFAPRSVLSRFGFEAAIQVGAVVHHARQVCIGAHLPHQPRRVPCGAGCQLVFFDDDDILPPHFCQVIRDTCPAHTAADDDHLRLCWESGHKFFSLISESNSGLLDLLY